MVKVEFKKLYEDSILPKKAHESDAGFDLYAHSFVDCDSMEPLDNDEIMLAPLGRVFVKAGFGMAIPPGYEAQVRPRSGLALKHGITVVNSPGTIDAGYRNEVGVILLNTSSPFYKEEVFMLKNCLKVTKGDRIAQLVIQKLPEVEVVEVNELTDPSDRGAAGFGSTGV